MERKSSGDNNGLPQVHRLCHFGCKYYGPVTGGVPAHEKLAIIALALLLQACGGASGGGTEPRSPLAARSRRNPAPSPTSGRRCWR
jgi:hypothetical protein